LDPSEFLEIGLKSFVKSRFAAFKGSAISFPRIAYFMFPDTILST